VLTNADFEELIDDTSKRIEGDIRWLDDDDHFPSVEFRVKVDSSAGYPLFARGSFNVLNKALSYTLVHAQAGRIYALDMGRDHRNPTGELVGDKHKHRWTERYRDKRAYVPEDITEPSTNPVAVWGQFCTEAKISHTGVLQPPPHIQRVIFI
jgi:hypothetical protein